MSASPESEEIERLSREVLDLRSKVAVLESQRRSPMRALHAAVLWGLVAIVIVAFAQYLRHAEAQRAAQREYIESARGAAASF
jgi:hypothetical protein